MNRLGRELSDEERQNPENSVEFWREQVKEHGVADVKRRAEAPSLASEIWQYFAKDAVDEYENNQKKQLGKRDRKRDKREKTALKLAKEANTIAKKTRREMRYTWVAAVVVALLTFVFGFLT